jgi:hypothetical protein
MSRCPHFAGSWLRDGGKVVSLAHWPTALPTGRLLIVISVRRSVDPRALMWLEGLIDKLKNRMTSSGTEPRPPTTMCPLWLLVTKSDVWKLLFFLSSCRAPSLMRGWVCSVLCSHSEVWVAQDPCLYCNVLSQTLQILSPLFLFESLSPYITL